MWLKKNKEDNVTYIGNGNVRKINKKKLIVLIIVVLVIWFFASVFATYLMDENFRKFMDINVFMKNMEDEDVVTVEIGNVNEDNIFAYSNYVAVIKDNVLTTYNSNGKEAAKLNVEVSSPIIDTNEDYAVIAERNGQALYSVYRNEVLWNRNVEGNISRINVNSNGYVSIVVTGTSYKSVIILYDKNGNEIFKTYLSSTIVVDTDVSEDNKYLSFAEINMSGTLIQSNIKRISIDKAKDSPSDSIVHKYSAEADRLIVDIKYQNKKLVCMYDDSIHVIDNENDKKIVDFNENSKNIIFSDINLRSYVVDISEKSSGMFGGKTTVTLTNSQNEKQNFYNIDGTAKELYCSEDRVGINLGNEVHFIDMNGWLVKKYTSGKDVKKIVVGGSIAGIVQKDRIKILNL